MHKKKNIFFKTYIKIKSFNYKLLDNVLLNIIKLLKFYKFKIGNIIHMPTKIERFDILRSPHVDKKSRDQLEIRTYYRIIKIFNFSFSKNYLLSLINLYNGIFIKIKIK